MCGLLCLRCRRRRQQQAAKVDQHVPPLRLQDVARRLTPGDLPPQLGEETGTVLPSTVDLGPGQGDFTLKARIVTTQSDAALMGKMMPRELYAPQSSPRGGWKMLVVRDGKLCWEISSLGRLHGMRAINDGLEHEVGVSYSAEEDTFTLLVDGAPDGSGLRGVADHCDSKWAMGNSDRLPTWSVEAASCRFDTASGAIIEILWNGKKLLTRTPTSIAKPAYADGQCIEYYSRTHGIWLSGDVSVKVTDCGDSRPQMATYSVTLRGSQQRRSAVGLSCLRLPLELAEPCEYYEQEQDCWLAAQVRGALLETSLPTYELVLEGEDLIDQPPVTANSILVRRRFPKGSQVLVYRGLTRGWVLATVMGGGEHEEHRVPEGRPNPEPMLPLQANELELGAPLSGPVASDATAISLLSVGTAGPFVLGLAQRTEGPKAYNWAQVWVCEEADESGRWQAVPAYLLRFHPDYLSHLSMEQVVQETVQQALDDLDLASDPSLDGVDNPVTAEPAMPPDAIETQADGIEFEDSVIAI